MKKTRTAHVGEILIYNPGVPPTWPGERTRNMAKRKKKGGHKRRNTASVTTARPAAHKKASPKRNPKRGGWKMRNPLGGKLPGLKELGGGAAALIVTEAINVAFPGWLGKGIQFGVAVVGPSVLPAGWGPAFALVAAANATKNTVNQFFDVSGLVQRSVQGLIPANVAAPGNGAGMGRFGGLIGVPQSSVLNNLVS